MSRPVNRWAALVGWVVIMLIAWTLLVPRALSFGTFVLLCLAGPVLLLAGTWLLNAQRPTPSIRQARATLDAEERARTDVRAGR